MESQLSEQQHVNNNSDEAASHTDHTPDLQTEAGKRRIA